MEEAWQLGSQGSLGWEPTSFLQTGVLSTSQESAGGGMLCDVGVSSCSLQPASTGGNCWFRHLQPRLISLQWKQVTNDTWRPAKSHGQDLWMLCRLVARCLLLELLKVPCFDLFKAIVVLLDSHIEIVTLLPNFLNAWVHSSVHPFSVLNVLFSSLICNHRSGSGQSTPHHTDACEVLLMVLGRWVWCVIVFYTLDCWFSLIVIVL